MSYDRLPVAVNTAPCGVLPSTPSGSSGCGKRRDDTVRGIRASAEVTKKKRLKRWRRAEKKGTYDLEGTLPSLKKSNYYVYHNVE